MRAGNRRPLVLAFMAVMAGVNGLSAHRLDEYLQAARIDIEPDRAEVQLDLTPGVAVAEGIIADIDRDRDGLLSADEKDAYVSRVLGAVVLELDGRPLHVRSTAATFPEIDAFRRGEGTIRVQTRAVLPPLADGDHQLHFRNTHDRGASVYLANALVPKSARVGVTAQRRDGDQSELTIDFVTSPGSATPVRIWLLTTLAGVALTGFLTKRWRARSKRGRMLSVASAAALGTLAAGLFSVTPFAQKSEPPARTSFVELDAVVLDKGGRSVRGLHKGDFQIEEDGQSVALASVTEVAAAGISGRDDGRSVVLLLYNTDVRSQILARQFVARARPADSIAVVRMTHRDDEVAGDRREALRRIDEPQGINIVQGRSRVEDSLETIARVARDLESTEHRHKVLVCIASRSLCDVYLAPPKTESLLWPHWTKAVDAAARANVSVYYVDPSGTATLTRPPLGDGLVEHTGGDTFFNSNNYQHIVDRVWDEAGHHYILGYEPTAEPRELHTIDVRTTRAGLHVRARRSRGD